MTLVSRLRRSVALLICPELRAAEDTPALNGRVGLYELDQAEVDLQRRRDQWLAAERASRIASPNREPIAIREGAWARLRNAPPAFIPGVVADVFMQAVGAVLSPLVMAGPEIEKRLRPHAEQLSDNPNPTRVEHALTVAILWLIGSPEIEPESTEADPQERSALLAAALDLWGHPQETQTQPSPDRDTGEGKTPICAEVREQSLREGHANKSQGAH